MRFYLYGFLLLMGFDTLAQISFKFTALHAQPLEISADWVLRVFGQPWLLGALAGYLGSFFTWMTLLRRVPIGPAFAASHLEVISVMAASAWLFGEPLSLTRLLGAVLIFAGIGFLAYAESRENRESAA